MWKLLTFLVASCCTVNFAQSEVLKICENLKPENITIEEFAGEWIMVEAYLEFGVAYQAMSAEQRNLSSMCESFVTRVVDQEVNETRAVGVLNVMRPYNLETRTENVTFRMLKLGVFSFVEGINMTVVAVNENKNYMTVANCQYSDMFDASFPLYLATIRSSSAAYCETSLQELRAKSQQLFGLQNITPLPYRKDCTVPSTQ